MLYETVFWNQQSYDQKEKAGNLVTVDSESQRNVWPSATSSYFIDSVHIYCPLET